MYKPTKRVYAAILICLMSCYIIICAMYDLNYENHYAQSLVFFQNKFDSILPQYTKLTNIISKQNIQTGRIVIGLVSCRAKDESKGNFYHEQTFTLIKSLLISCKLYNIPTLEIHLFLEHLKDEEIFRREIKENLHFPQNESQIQLTLQVHSAVDVVPKKYRDHMIYHPRYRCCYVRHYFPEALPNIDSIIHLDSDMIVTGNIGRHWQLLSEMNENQMVSVSYGRQPENDKFKSQDSYIYRGTPFVPPKGVQPALLIMNLTRMREFKMSEKITRIYQDYSKIKGLQLHDMKVFNILLYYNPAIYLIFPCELHFLAYGCLRGFFCESAYQDPDGLHLVHGNEKRFRANQIFHPIYKYYAKFNISDPQSNLTRDIMKPIQEAYSVANSPPPNPCYGNLDKILFKRFLPISNSSK